MAVRARIGIFFIGLLLVVARPVVAAGAGGALHASAELRDTSGVVVGWAQFTEDAGGILHANVHVKGLSEGLHGIHIHAAGNCDSTIMPFDGAKGHHNPGIVEHGLDSDHGGHAGDLPNLTVNGTGNGHLNVTSDRATLSAGDLSVFDTDGSALVIHALTDDQVSNPTGNSGTRIACGVIVAG